MSVEDLFSEPNCEDRCLIEFGEYAEIDQPGVRKGWRNPVKYTSLEDLGIDTDALTFRPMPEPAPV